MTDGSPIGAKKRPAWADARRLFKKEGDRRGRTLVRKPLSTSHPSIPLRMSVFLLHMPIRRGHEHLIHAPPPLHRKYGHGFMNLLRQPQFTPPECTFVLWRRIGNTPGDIPFGRDA